MAYDDDAFYLFLQKQKLVKKLGVCTFPLADPCAHDQSAVSTLYVCVSSCLCFLLSVLPRVCGDGWSSRWRAECARFLWQTTLDCLFLYLFLLVSILCCLRESVVYWYSVNGFLPRAPGHLHLLAQTRCLMACAHASHFGNQPNIDLINQPMGLVISPWSPAPPERHPLL